MLLNIQNNGQYLDATVGHGGHAEALLSRLGADGRLTGLDRDDDALERTRKRIGHDRRLLLCKANYADMESVLGVEAVGTLDGIVMDLGVSSGQLDEAGRGFSFMKDGPLDMRMDRQHSLTAAEIVNSWPEAELVRILRVYGEEPSARRIAQAIVENRLQRPFSTTTELAELIEQVKGGRRGKIHPATQAFQAIRMAVNDELGGLERGLESALRLLASGGRLAVISFHSLEDRIVKHRFRDHIGRMESLQAGGERWVGKEPKVRSLTKKPVVPTQDECSRNPRARSAKLRAVERI